jgi:glycosyltransferase involved in cell wall biosynthesis
MRLRMVLICTESLPAPAVKGGAIQMFIDGITPFLAEPYDLTICSISDPSLPDSKTCDQVRYVRFPQEEYAGSVAAHLKEEAYDLVHVFNRPLDLLIYAAAAPESRFVLGLHNDMLAPEKISQDEGDRVINTVVGIITISDFIRKKVVGRFPEAEGKCRVVYSGVDLRHFPARQSDEAQLIREEWRRRFGVSNRTVVLFAGRLSPNKGVHVLIDSMKLLFRKHPGLVLMIAGGKWFSDDGMNRYTRKLRSQADKLKDRVLFTGFIPADQIGNLFLAADIFVCPSLWEERVHYEAMAAGVPVITTDRGGNGEVIIHKQNGWVITDCESPIAYSQAIEFFLRNQELATYMTANGRHLVETAFQFNHAARRFLTAWEAFIDRGAEQIITNDDETFPFHSP